MNVLDHGFVKLLNIAGPTRRPDATFDADDIDPAQTARISFNQMGSERTRDQEIRLCEYLMRNLHTTPIEMIETWWQMKLPIFIARQFIRHRTATVNEVSGRYVTLPAEWYIPDVVGAAPTDGAKQGQSEGLDETVQEWFKWALDIRCSESYEDYLTAIERGIAPEHARLLLHLNHYTEWVWKQDLHNLFHFLSLRDDSHAQIEARVYARAMVSQLEEVLPELTRLYRTYRRRDS